MKLKATASYRMPRETKTEPSRVLGLFWYADGTCRMTGGKWGTHQIHEADAGTASRQRIRAHWFGYVSQNMGRTVTPSITWTMELK